MAATQNKMMLDVPSTGPVGSYRRGDTIEASVFCIRNRFLVYSPLALHAPLPYRGSLCLICTKVTVLLPLQARRCALIWCAVFLGMAWQHWVSWGALRNLALVDPAQVISRIPKQRGRSLQSANLGQRLGIMLKLSWSCECTCTQTHRYTHACVL